MVFRNFFLGILLASTHIAVEANQALEAARATQNVFAEVAEKTLDAVVVVKFKSDEPPEERLLREQALRELLGVSPNQLDSEPSFPPGAGQASGVLITPAGHVLTNNHVVAGQKRLSVVMRDGKEYPAEIVGVDPKTDLAVLKIKSDKPFPFLRFAKLEDVKVGHWAIAVGCPLRLDWTFTVGVVSHIGRAMGMNAYENYIQTDAAINLGNSGGPLLNIDGDIIGIIDFIFSPQQSDGNIGLAFAISSKLAKEVSDALMADGKVVRPWIGITMRELQRQSDDAGKTSGAVEIAETVVGDPADNAGLRPGDVILSVDGTQVSKSKEIQNAILRHKPGDDITFKILRDGKETDVKVKAGRQHSDTLAGEPPITKESASFFSRHGLHLTEENNMVSVKSVDTGSPADKAGLLPGMLIHTVNKSPVSCLADVEEALKAAPGRRDVLLSVSQDGKRKYFVLSPK